MGPRPSMLRRRAFLTAAGGTVATGTVGCLDGTGEHVPREVDDLERNERATVIAHRGFADSYPENTVEAFELAVQGETDDAADRRAADWIELDVMPTSDGEIVVFHDEQLGGLTDVQGVVHQLAADEVLSAEVLASGATVPTFSAAMDAIPAEVGVNVDVKSGSDRVQRGRVSDPSEEREEWAWLETVIDIAADQDNELLLSSFWEGALFAIRQLDPELPIAYIFSGSIDGGLAVTDEYEAAAISAPIQMIDRAPFFDPSYEQIDLVGAAHDRDLPIHGWTLDTWYEVEQVTAAGLDGLFLDYAEIVRWGGRE